MTVFNNAPDGGWKKVRVFSGEITVTTLVVELVVAPSGSLGQWCDALDAADRLVSFRA